jgi:lipopolysaccharide transport system ATP-binding protein
MSDEVLVRVDGVGKKFCRSLKKSLWYGVCDIAGELLPGRKRESQRTDSGLLRADGPATSYPPLVTSPTGEASLRDGEFWAVKDVSFELRRGECLGLIGHNGAGKTTLLKMLNGLIKPDAGSITMRGRVGALIALGAGFNPILTGRENIYINGSVLGLTKKEIDAKIDEIIDFADVREAIDMPVQNYSSGMNVRLGFAVATTLEPDILILDEVLAVGDAKFRNKCYNKIGKMHSKAAAIFVSHSMEQISQICDKVLVMKKGEPYFCGGLAEGIAIYESLNTESDDQENNAFETIEYPIESFDIQLDPENINGGESTIVEINVKSRTCLTDLCLRIVIYDSMGVLFAEWNNSRIEVQIELKAGLNRIKIPLGPLMLKKGSYKLGVALSIHGGAGMLAWSFKKHIINIESPISIGPTVALMSKPITES